MKWIADGFGMTDEVWERHTSPWSIWTRFPILPVAVLALLLRQDLGWWLLPVFLVLGVWTWVNPRAFPPAEERSAWGVRGVYGEKLWIERATRPIPEHHARWGTALAYLPIVGILPMVWGIVTLDWAMAFTGCAMAILAKLWFLDRMVWLCDDMARESPEVRLWLAGRPAGI